MHPYSMHSTALLLSYSVVIVKVQISLHLIVHGIENSFFMNAFVSSQIQDKLVY